MAVYTHISQAELEEFISSYDIGTLQEWNGITAGIENSNFYVRTDKAQYILTIYEKRVSREDLPFFLEFKKHLAANGFSCPLPIADKQGEIIREIQAKPAAIISFLQGKSTNNIQNQHCVELGKAMAQMHLASQDFPMQRANDLSVAGWQEMFVPLKDKVDTIRPDLSAEISRQLDSLAKNWPSDLPKGVIHADLFPDNIFFLRDKLSGIIDFYFACNDILAYDIAICFNAWCFEKNGEFNITKARRILKGYNSVRQLSDAEINALPILASGAAMRFLLTRLHDWLSHQDETAVVNHKDPLEYWHKLSFHKKLSKPADYVL